MLVAVKTWALSHLLVNGDLGSMLLFGALLAWAVYDRIAAKRRGDAGAPPVAGFGRNDAIVIAIGTVAYFLVLWLHESLIGVAAAYAVETCSTADERNHSLVKSHTTN